MNIVIPDKQPVCTQGSVFIQDDDGNDLFEIILGNNNNLAIFGINRISSNLLIEPRTINSVIVKIER